LLKKIRAQLATLGQDNNVEQLLMSCRCIKG